MDVDRAWTAVVAVAPYAREQVVADGKLRTAFALLEIGSDEYLDVAILEGPLELEGEPKDAP